MKVAALQREATRKTLQRKSSVVPGTPVDSVFLRHTDEVESRNNVRGRCDWLPWHAEGFGEAGVIPRYPHHAFSWPPLTPSIGPFSYLRYTPRQIALLPGDAQHLVVVEADHNEYNEAQGQVRGTLTALLRVWLGLCLLLLGGVCAKFDLFRSGERVNAPSCSSSLSMLSRMQHFYGLYLPSPSCCVSSCQCRVQFTRLSRARQRARRMPLRALQRTARKERLVRETFRLHKLRGARPPQTRWSRTRRRTMRRPRLR